MTIVNLTPHPVRIMDDQGNVVKTYQPSGQTARISEDTSPPNKDGTVNVHYGNVHGLENQEQTGVTYIVSLLVALAARDRGDLVFPFDLVRNDEGTVIGSKRLARVR